MTAQPTARLPVTDTALALALLTVGFKVAPKETYHDREGTTHLTWFVDSRVKEAQAIVHNFLSADPAKSLHRTAPDSPFMAARWGLEALATLRGWLENPARVPAMVRTHGRLWRLVPAHTVPTGADSLPYLWGAGIKPTECEASLPRAAALAVCGFPIYPRVLPPTGTRDIAFAFPAESISFPGLLATHLPPPSTINSQPSTNLLTTFPPGYPPGEHPFEYAAQAAANYQEIAAPLKIAAAHRSIFFRGQGQTGAFCSAKLLDPTYKNSAFRDRLTEHLT